MGNEWNEEIEDLEPASNRRRDSDGQQHAATLPTGPSAAHASPQPMSQTAAPALKAGRRVRSRGAAPGVDIDEAEAAALYFVGREDSRTQGASSSLPRSATGIPLTGGGGGRPEGRNAKGEASMSKTASPALSPGRLRPRSRTPGPEIDDAEAAALYFVGRDDTRRPQTAATLPRSATGIPLGPSALSKTSSPALGQGRLRPRRLPAGAEIDDAEAAALYFVGQEEPRSQGVSKTLFRSPERVAGIRRADSAAPDMYHGGAVSASRQTAAGQPSGLSRTARVSAGTDVQDWSALGGPGLGSSEGSGALGDGTQRRLSGGQAGGAQHSVVTWSAGDQTAGQHLQTGWSYGPTMSGPIQDLGTQRSSGGEWQPLFKNPGSYDAPD